MVAFGECSSSTIVMYHATVALAADPKDAALSNAPLREGVGLFSFSYSELQMQEL